jgi:hypothetical protein
MFVKRISSFCQTGFRTIVRAPSSSTTPANANASPRRRPSAAKEGPRPRIQDAAITQNPADGR